MKGALLEIVFDDRLGLSIIRTRSFPSTFSGHNYLCYVVVVTSVNLKFPRRIPFMWVAPSTWLFSWGVPSL